MRFFFLFQYMLHFDGWEGQFEVRRNITGGSLKVIQQPATLWRLLEGSVAQGTANTLVPYYQSKSGNEEKVLSWYCHGNLVAYLLFWGVPPRTKGSTNGGMLGYRAEIQCCQLVSQENAHARQPCWVGRPWASVPCCRNQPVHWIDEGCIFAHERRRKRRVRFAAATCAFPLGI